MKIDDGIDKLNAAYKRLDEPQGRIARRNARQAFLYALRALRKGLDDEFPAIRKPITSRKKPDPKRALRGKVEIGDGLQRELLAAGVSAAQFVERTFIIGTSRNKKRVVYVPRWIARACGAGIDPKLIAKAVRSRTVRKRIDAIIRLGRTRA